MFVTQVAEPARSLLSVPYRGIVLFARLSFDLLMRLLELLVSGLFDVGDVIVGVFHRQNELRQFDLESLCVVVLRVLNKKDHEEGYNRCAGIDDELPGVAVVKDRATYAPHQDHRDRRQKSSGLA